MVRPNSSRMPLLRSRWEGINSIRVERIFRPIRVIRCSTSRRKPCLSPAIRPRSFMALFLNSSSKRRPRWGAEAQNARPGFPEYRRPCGSCLLLCRREWPCRGPAAFRGACARAGRSNTGKQRGRVGQKIQASSEAASGKKFLCLFPPLAGPKSKVQGHIHAVFAQIHS